MLAAHCNHWMTSSSPRSRSREATAGARLSCRLVGEGRAHARSGSAPEATPLPSWTRAQPPRLRHTWCAVVARERPSLGGAPRHNGRREAAAPSGRGAARREGRVCPTPRIRAWRACLEESAGEPRRCEKAGTWRTGRSAEPRGTRWHSLCFYSGTRPQTCGEVLITTLEDPCCIGQPFFSSSR